MGTHTPGAGPAFAAALLLHKIPEGLALGTILRASVDRAWKAFALCAAVELSTVVGGATGLWLTPADWVSYPLAIAGGTFLFLGRSCGRQRLETPGCEARLYPGHCRRGGGGAPATGPAHGREIANVSRAGFPLSDRRVGISRVGGADISARIRSGSGGDSAGGHRAENTCDDRRCGDRPDGRAGTAYGLAGVPRTSGQNRNSSGLCGLRRGRAAARRSGGCFATTVLCAGSNREWRVRGRIDSHKCQWIAQLSLWTDAAACTRAASGSGERRNAGFEARREAAIRCSGAAGDRREQEYSRLLSSSRASTIWTCSSAPKARWAWLRKPNSRCCPRPARC